MNLCKVYLNYNYFILFSILFLSILFYSFIFHRRSKSGAKIQLSEADKESKDDRVITMSGTQQQIQLAEQLMTEWCV